MKTWKIGMLIAAVIVALPSSQYAFADYQDKVEFASGLEQALGHFWALELNIDERNTDLALVHALHPIEELYDAMKPVLAETDRGLDTKVQDTLMDLRTKVGAGVSEREARMAVDDARETIIIARNVVVGDAYDDPAFKMALMKDLLAISIEEYNEAISDGAITNMPEFQDGAAFVWRSEQLFADVRPHIDAHEAEEIETFFADLQDAYDRRADPSEVETIAGGIIHELGEAYMKKVEFASGLEQTLGHFWALDLTIDEGDTELALVHASHPIEELYDAMKPVLAGSDPDLDATVQDTLQDLRNHVGEGSSQTEARMAVNDARDVIVDVRSTIVGDIYDDSDFKIELMKDLLAISIEEYNEAISGGTITNMPEFQDGSAFVVRSQELFADARPHIDAHEAEEIETFFADLQDAYDRRADPSEVETIAGGIIHELDEILGTEHEEGDDLLEHVASIEQLLTSAKSEYQQGNSDLALSQVTKAYLNHYEFLEGPLVELGHRDLMIEVEIMMREDLRAMIKAGAPASEVGQQIDDILVQMETIGTIVPEFGTVAVMILAVAIVSIVAVTARSRLSFQPRI